MQRILRWFGVFFFGLLPAPAAALGQSPPLSFARDIRPILSDKCFQCHGPDEKQRQAELRLDTAAGARRDLGGHFAIVPGKPDESELWRRVTVDDDDERMPPSESGKSLSAAEVAKLRQWIAQGAEYQSHWSLVPPVKAAPSENRDSHWSRTPIDRFILAKLEREDVTPQPEADRSMLIRRLSLDLMGLPPSPEEINAFVNDPRPDAYDRLVDRLLASPHLGENFALAWLDAARYADTNGYFVDNDRQMWRWRDWVIAAFNRNLPFDQFTIEQLAGDLLPQPTLDQQIASGFNRNHPVTYESGIIDEEYRVEYVCDRVETTAAVWLGLTIGCARCHDHKYDPLPQRDFYRLFAFFNNVPEQGNTGREGNAVPRISAPLPEQAARLEKLEAAVQEREAAFAKYGDTIATEQEAWQREAASALRQDSSPTPVAGAEPKRCPGDGEPGHRSALPQPPATLNAGLIAQVDCEPGLPSSVRPQGKVEFAGGIVGQAASFDGDSWLELDAPLAPERDRVFSVAAWFLANADPGTIVCRFDDRDSLRGFNVMVEKSLLVVQLMHSNESESILLTSRRPVSSRSWHHMAVAYDGSSRARGVVAYLDGQPLDMKVVYDTLNDSIAVDLPWRVGRRGEGYGLKGLVDDVRIYDRVVTEREVAAWFAAERLRYLLELPADKRSPAEAEELRDHYLRHVAGEPVRGGYLALVAARRQRDAFQATVPTAMVMREMDPPRETFVLGRGQYDQPRERVSPGVPEALPPLPTDVKADRLALARWLVDGRHPLTARVIVNRFWHHYFGQGLVGTINDFGSQGEPPSHPELLDWLAIEFIESGWNIKALHRWIVTSATYRQSSSAAPERIASDPDNRLLGRGPRFRLPAELVRDQALVFGGLLAREIGGPSVKPYQPDGLWEAVSYGGEQSYEQDHGRALYRRGLYTFWKRQAPPPALLAFDAPTRETCVLRRSRTNTPLQALVVLNDPTYVEAARTLAERVLRSDCQTDDDRLRWAFLTVTSRRSDDAEHAELAKLLWRQTAKYRRDSRQAEALLSVGESPADDSVDASQLAAWTIVAHALLNLDEALCKN